MTSKVSVGPEVGESMLSGALDYYKPTMSQVEHLKHPGAEVTFTFKNRGEQDLLEYLDINELRQRLDRFKNGWSQDEVDFLRTHERRGGGQLFSDDFLRHLQSSDLPPFSVFVDDNNELAVTTSGEWSLATFWETVVMSEINELYFETLVRERGLDINDIYDEGDARLSAKIDILKTRPDIKFADFGTRRRFSYRWHKHVLSRLASECPENLIGTSNTWLAKEFNLMPIGTFAHEMPMVYAAIADGKGRNPLLGQGEMFNDWREVYDNNLSTVLPDTFGSEFFFADFTEEQAKHWQSIRHDSGNPTDFGEKVIAFYQELGINPVEKTIVFSDGLDIETIVKLADYFNGRVNVVFGWGTTLTNDLGVKPLDIEVTHTDSIVLKPLNIVMKATMADGTETVKLSDNEGKHTGSEKKVEKYKRAVANFCRLSGLKRLVPEIIGAKI